MSDQSNTYWSRVVRLAYMMDIRNAFVTKDRILEAKALVAEGPSLVDPKRMSDAKHVVDATVHPDTGEIIFAPLRLGFIVPMNCMLDACMISARGPLQIIAAQVQNQVYNAAHYRANRNATNTTDTTQLSLAYVFATVSSVGAALGLNKLADARATSSPQWARTIRGVGPFVAVAAADFVNLATMRYDEWMHGIDVYSSESGERVGSSRIAGAMAVSSCIFARVSAAAPVLLGSSYVHHALAARGKPRWVQLSGTLLALALAIQFAVPITFGVFPQTATVRVSRLEPELQDTVSRSDAFVTYNKGL